MGDSPFMLSATISIIYLLLRFLEMRFVLKEMKPLKTSGWKHQIALPG